MSSRRNRTCRVIDNPYATRTDLEWLGTRNRKALLSHPMLSPRMVRKGEWAYVLAHHPEGERLQAVALLLYGNK